MSFLVVAEFGTDAGPAEIANEALAELEANRERWGAVQDYPDTLPSDLDADVEEASESAAAWWKRENAARRATTGVAWCGLLAEATARALAEPRPQTRREELLKLIAVSVEWVAALDRRIDPMDPL